MIRHWLITSTTYGSWLPGDPRGFVGTVKVDAGPRVRHNQPETPYNVNMPGLRASARKLLKGPAVRLTQEQAWAVVE